MGENGNKILMALLLGVFIVTSLQFIGHFFYHESEPGKDYDIIGEVDGVAPPPEVEIPDPICHLLADADIEIGKQALSNCTSCHQFESQVHGQGPHLVDLIGREIASTDFGGYSSALRSLGGEWDQDTLNSFLHKPSQYVPGTAMNFAGWDNSKTKLRANVIAYLYDLSGAALPVCPAMEEEMMEEGEEAASTEG